MITPTGQTLGHIPVPDTVQPFEVRCRVTEPIVLKGDQTLHLDGILGYAVMMGLSREERQALPDVDRETHPGDFVLPLEHWVSDPDDSEHESMLHDGMLWGWKASDVQCEWEWRWRVDVRKRTDSGKMVRLGRRRRLNIRSGRFKPMNIPYQAVWPVGGELVWWGLGDPDKVAHLLERITHLGALRGHGHGKIELTSDGRGIWHVERIDEDRSCQHHGRLTRRMPASLFGDRIARIGTVRAPYWHRSRTCLCVGPE